MKIIIEGSAKEIAALILELSKPRDVVMTEEQKLTPEAQKQLERMIDNAKIYTTPAGEMPLR